MFHLTNTHKIILNHFITPQNSFSIFELHSNTRALTRAFNLLFSLGYIEDTTESTNTNPSPITNLILSPCGRALLQGVA